MWREVKKIINNHKNFVLTTHLNPDGDGIGAGCALTELLLKMNKTVRFVCDSPIPKKYSFMDFRGIHEIYDPSSDFSSVEVLMILDTHKKDRIGRLSELIDRPHVTTVCIDHHESASVSPYVKSVIDPKACSVGAMIYTLFKEYGYELNLAAATGIYASVICDTGRFCYSSTSRKAHKIAEECIKLGVDPDQMYSHLFQHVTLAETKLLAQALQAMETYLEDRVVIQQIRKEDCEMLVKNSKDLENVDLEYIHNFNHLIEDVHCFVLLREIDHNVVRVSMRSRSDLDISQFMRKLGGGGHPNAAGCIWKGSLKDIKHLILEFLKEKIVVKA